MCELQPQVGKLKTKVVNPPGWGWGGLEEMQLKKGTANQIVRKTVK